MGFGREVLTRNASGYARAKIKFPLGWQLQGEKPFRLETSVRGVARGSRTWGYLNNVYNAVSRPRLDGVTSCRCQGDERGNPCHGGFIGIVITKEDACSRPSPPAPIPPFGSLHLAGHRSPFLCQRVITEGRGLRVARLGDAATH